MDYKLNLGSHEIPLKRNDYDKRYNLLYEFNMPLILIFNMTLLRKNKVAFGICNQI